MVSMAGSRKKTTRNTDVFLGREVEPKTKVVANRRYENCRVWGPAHVVLVRGQFTYNEFFVEGGYQAGQLQLAEGEPVPPGVIYLVDVDIQRCALIDVRLVIPYEQAPSYFGGIMPGWPEDLPPGARPAS